MKHTMKLANEPFKKIKNGSKIIEVRLFDDKRKKINLKDGIIFQKLSNPKESVSTTVTNLFRFNSFKNLFSHFGTAPFGHPESMSIDERILKMRNIYSEGKERKYGVLGIQIKLI